MSEIYFSVIAMGYFPITSNSGNLLDCSQLKNTFHPMNDKKKGISPVLKGFLVEVIIES